jgi:hypothetical protein
VSYQKVRIHWFELWARVVQSLKHQHQKAVIARVNTGIQSLGQNMIKKISDLIRIGRGS